MKVAVIGSSGYIGSRLTVALQDRHELSLVDLVPYDAGRVPWVYDCLKVERREAHVPQPSSKLPFTRGDITDWDTCRRITENVDAVVLLSAYTSEEQVLDCFRVNALGTFQVLHAAGLNGVKRVLAASSINASGLFYCRVTERPRPWAYLPVDEDIPTDHEDTYSLAKYVNELNCVAWSNRFGMTTAALRFAGVFPPEWTETYAQAVTPTTEWPFDLSGYVDVRDVVTGLVQALECESLPPSGTYQLAAADTRMLEPTMQVIERFRPDLVERIRCPLPGHTSMLSHERAHRAFRFTPRHTWRGGASG